MAGRKTRIRVTEFSADGETVGTPIPDNFAASLAADRQKRMRYTFAHDALGRAIPNAKYAYWDSLVDGERVGGVVPVDVSARPDMAARAKADAESEYTHRVLLQEVTDRDEFRDRLEAANAIIEKVRALYERRCAQTIVAFTDEEEEFLADLSMAISPDAMDAPVRKAERASAVGSDAAAEHQWGVSIVGTKHVTLHRSEGSARSNLDYFAGVEPGVTRVLVTRIAATEWAEVAE